MISSGGAATNTALWFARLGLQTACISEIGQDIGGAVVLQELQREGVDISHMVKESNEETGISGLLISQDGARTALVHRGAAGMLTVNDLDLDAIETKWIHLSSIGNLELIAHIFDVCAQKHIKLSWNPGNWEIDQMVSGQLKPAWDVVEILFVNRKEMAQLGNMDLADETVWKSDWCFVGPKSRLLPMARMADDIVLMEVVIGTMVFLLRLFKKLAPEMPSQAALLQDY